MGSCFPFDNDATFDDHVKTMADEELLEIWEETQKIDILLHRELSAGFSMAPEFEKAIVAELSLRTTRNEVLKDRPVPPRKSNASGVLP